MDSFTKHISRLNKKAVKFQFTVSYHELQVVATSKWQPNQLSVVWTRRNRRLMTEPRKWEPTLKNSFSSKITWTVPENKEVLITLFGDPKTHELEDKKWTFYLEDVSSTKKRRQLAKAYLNMKSYASIVQTQQQVDLIMDVTSKKIAAASLSFTVSCVFVSEGIATEDDLRSLASFITINRASDDVAILEDFEEEDEDTETNGMSPNSNAPFNSITNETGFHYSTPTASNEKNLKPKPDVVLPVTVPEKGAEIKDRLSNSTPPVRKNQNEMKFQCTAAFSSNEGFLESSQLESKRGAIESVTAAVDEFGDDAIIKKRFSSAFNEIVNETEFQPTPSAFNLDDRVFLESWEFEPSKPDAAPVIAAAKISTGAALEIPSMAAVNPFWEDLTHQPSEKESTLKLNSPTLTYRLNPFLSEDELIDCFGTGNELQETEELPFTSTCKLEPDTLSGDLLEWCQKITLGYDGVNILNFTTSWRDGLALCAIIHYFRPEIIHYESLNKLDTQANGKLAFEIGERLGVARNFAPKDLIQSTVPDELAVMSYVRQLRDCLVGQHTQIKLDSQTEHSTIDSREFLNPEICNTLRPMESETIDSICYSSQSHTDHVNAEPSCYAANELDESSEAEQIGSSRSKIHNPDSNRTVQEPWQISTDQMRESSTKYTDEMQDFDKKNEIMEGRESSHTGMAVSKSEELDEQIVIEFQDLERQQLDIDRQANVLKNELRWLSEGGSISPFCKEMEEYLLKQLFNLINKKNAIIRRQEQLNLLNKKINLEQRYVSLERDIRDSLSINDGQKTEAQRLRENLLLKELVINVNQRDEIVHHLDIQEKALEEDEIIQRKVNSAL